MCDDDHNQKKKKTRNGCANKMCVLVCARHPSSEEWEDEERKKHAVRKICRYIVLVSVRPALLETSEHINLEKSIGMYKIKHGNRIPDSGNQWL